MPTDTALTCLTCGVLAIAMDTDTGAGYCVLHFTEQQAGTQPLTYFRSVPA